MYAKASGLLDEEAYKKLINPFLNEAENSLKSVQFCGQNQSCIECQQYFAFLLHYNVACFQNYAQNSLKTNFILETRKQILKCTIENLAFRGALQKDKVEEELQKTEQLFLDGNKTFYSALPWHVKFALWWSE